MIRDIELRWSPGLRRQQPHPGAGGPAPCEVTGVSGGAHGGGVIPSPAALTRASPGTLFPAHAVTALRSGECGGAPHVAVYDGSLVEWSANRALPMETG